MLMAAAAFALGAGAMAYFSDAQAQMLTGYYPEAHQEAPVYKAPAAPAPLPDGIPETKAETGTEAAPVDLTADRMTHDEQRQIITASGNVNLAQAGRTLRADEVVYDLQSDKAVAKGNVILTDKNGDMHFAEQVVLNNEMRDGFVEQLQSRLSGGGRLSAQSGERKDAHVIILHDASYTACDCNDGDGAPAWRMKAKKATYDEEKHRISYNNARFEAFGVPVFWTPYFSHSDGKVKRKSGLLTPDAGYDSDLGAVLTGQYYWAMAPDRDATLGVMAMSKKAPVLLGEYRQRFASADIELKGSATHSGRTDKIGEEDVHVNNEWRGRLQADGHWDINDKWRGGANVNITSDDQYLRQYSFSNADILENEVFVERFSGRNYIIGRALAFQDLRTLEQRTDQPNVLPEVTAVFEGAPNGVLGGRWQVEASALGLQRNGSGQDVSRLSAQAGWQRRYTANAGLVSTLDAAVRGDAYQVTDRELTGLRPGSALDVTETRLFPSVNLVSSLPLAKTNEKTQTVIEPVAAVTLAPDINAGASEIPNEDSKDAQIDANNIFIPNRFPGYDRIEDGSHATYGMRWGVYGYNGSYLQAFAGQSYRFDSINNPFPRGSGLSSRSSDYVGQLSGQYDGRMGFDYRFQLDDGNLAAQRHEFDGYMRMNRFRMDARYLFAKALEGTGIAENREQVQGSAAYDIARRWRARSSALYDLGEDKGLRRVLMGFDYFGCCSSFSITADRRLTTDSSGDNGTSIMFHVGLKGLGDFQTPESGTGLTPFE